MSHPARNRLSHYTTDRPVAVLVVFLAAVVFGFFSLKKLPVTLMPELSYPTVTVRTEYPGAAPEEVENEISRPIEEALGVIGGLKKISSISRAGISDVVLEFVWGTDMSDAMQDTLEKLDLIFLPTEAEPPLILQFDPSLDPIMELSFSGEGDRYSGEAGLRRLRRIADLEIKRVLEPIKGVAAARIRGGLEEEFHVLVDAEMMRRSGLSIQQVIDRLRQENINVAGGTLKEGISEFMVRALNEYQNIEQIEDTVIVRNEGRAIRVKDLGRVERSHREREIITRADGRESVQIDIYKEADANIVAVAKAITDRIGEIVTEEVPEKTPRFGAAQQEKPVTLAQQLWNEEGARLMVVADRSTFIESSISEVRNTAVLGGLLAVIVLFLFLQNVKPTAIIAISIPISIFITFAPLNLLDVSLNIMSLGGLAMGVGMLVDSSIVVLESIFRCKEEGDDIKTAAIRGTAEVRGAVVASTLTSVCVFFPMVFVEGIAGQAFGDLGLAVVISLIASLLVSVTFIPMLASRQKFQFRDESASKYNWFQFAAIRDFSYGIGTLKGWTWIFAPYFILKLLIGLLLEFVGKILLMIFNGISVVVVGIAKLAAKTGGAIISLPLKAAGGFINGITNLYPGVIRWALKNPLAIFLLIVANCVVTWQVTKSLGTELLPEVHQGEVTFEVSLPVGTPIEETQAKLTEIEQAILENKEDIHSVLVTFGYDFTNMKRSDEGEHSARFKILLKSGRNPVAVEDRVVSRLREYFDIPDVQQRVVRPVLFSSETPIEVEVYGDDLVQLREAASRVKEVMAGLPELADVETTMKRGAPEVQVVYDRDQIVRFGMNINQVATQVRNMVQGFEATQFNMGDRRIPILVRLNQSDREQLDDIARLTINPGEENPIPLSAVAELKVGEGPSEIRRIDARRVALVQANIRQGSLGAAVASIETALNSQIDWPGDMSYLITGQNEEWNRSKGSLYLALGLSIFLVYVIMAAQFESLVQPLIIMFTIPLAFLGTVVGLKVFGMSISIVVFLGVIMLAGIVVNNAIVFVDYVNTLKGRGMELTEALVTAGSVRLRPILMTTATTVLGLLPMALGLGDGAEIRTPMAVAVICGLVSSTILTLLIIPTIYFLLDSAKTKLVGASEPAEIEQSDQLAGQTSGS